MLKKKKEKKSNRKIKINKKYVFYQNGLFFVKNATFRTVWFQDRINLTLEDPIKEDDFESCFMPNGHKIGNGVCNDELNLISCDYDGGDCCLNQVNIYACTRCLCHKDPQKCPNTNLMGNGVCDVQLQSQESCIAEWQDCSKSKPINRKIPLKYSYLISFKSQQ